jgi:hypothetical protein
MTQKPSDGPKNSYFKYFWAPCVCMEGGCFGLRPLVGVFINIMVVCSRRGFVCEGVVAKFAFLAQMEQLQGHI